MIISCLTYIKCTTWSLCISFKSQVWIEKDMFSTIVDECNSCSFAAQTTCSSNLKRWKIMAFKPEFQLPLHLCNILNFSKASSSRTNRTRRKKCQISWEYGSNFQQEWLHFPHLFIFLYSMKQNFPPNNKISWEWGSLFPFFSGML